MAVERNEIRMVNTNLVYDCSFIISMRQMGIKQAIIVVNKALATTSLKNREVSKLSNFLLIFNRAYKQPISIIMATTYVM